MRDTHGCKNDLALEKIFEKDLIRYISILKNLSKKLLFFRTHHASLATTIRQRGAGLSWLGHVVKPSAGSFGAVLLARFGPESENGLIKGGFEMFDWCMDNQLAKIDYKNCLYKLNGAMA